MSTTHDQTVCHHHAMKPTKPHLQGGIAESISALADSFPTAVALSDRHGVLSYRELDSRSTQIAHHLRALGVGPNVVVGLCLPGSAAMVVGALGILKAGGAYLPLDPESPHARLEFLLRDGEAPVLLAADCLIERLPKGAWKVVGLDPQGNVIAHTGVPDGPFTSLPNSRPDDLAYVIYTSGSTGQPKGVEIPHRALLNLISWHQRAFSVTADDRATQIASPGFDAAVWEVWPYLTAGASVHVPEENMRADVASLKAWLLAQQITITFLPTPMAEQMIHEQWPADTSLRVLLTGADTLHHYPPANLPFVLVNNYGPTECTVVATSGVVPSVQQNSLPTIGSPIDNVSAYILDQEMQPVAAGLPGELYVGGMGVARGYRNRPDLTAERFLQDPFSNEPGARMYRTGDAASFLENGEIAFLGRLDDQVKIRGYRIEPDEIVAYLDSHPAVGASVVIAREDATGKRLVAYVVPKPDAQLNAKALREFLAERMPDYMMPSLFVQLEALPLNASGKVDRKALPVPTDSNTLVDEAYVAPRSAIERSVAQLLESLLGVKLVGLNDNFFLIGGNSLLGAQVIARVRDTFGVDLTLLALFDHPSVAELSDEIEQLITAKVDAMSEAEARQSLQDSDTQSMSQHI